MRFFQRAKERAYDATIGKLVIKMSLEQQVELARRFPAPVIEKQKGLLKTFPKDVQKLADEGQTEEEIKAHYWGCQPFKEYWESLDLIEDTLDGMIHDAVLNSVHR